MDLPIKRSLKAISNEASQGKVHSIFENELQKGEKWTGVNPENYRIKDDIVVEVDIEEKNPDGSFKPFKADDIQLEFIRLDPYHRLFLKQQGDSATYKAHLVVPDTLAVSLVSPI